MKTVQLFFLLISTVSAAYADNGENGKSRFVLAELFTSQGCSSCPPADELLSIIAEEPEYKGRIIPLSFHVDYWDRLGWKDPFSHQHWTMRQKRYAYMFHLDTIYTPQLVVDGHYQWVGSDEESVRNILNKSFEEEDDIELILSIPLIEDVTDSIHIQINGIIMDTEKTAHAELFVVMYENGMVTEVPHGENAGQTLQNDYVVRKMYREPLKLNEKDDFYKSIDMKWDEEINLTQSGVVAFVQNFSERMILGVSKKPFIEDGNK